MNLFKFITIILVFQSFTLVQKTVSVDPFSLFALALGTGLSLGFGIWGVLDPGPSNERKTILAKVQDIEIGLEKLSYEMNHILSDIKLALSVSPFLNKWWAMRIDFEGKMDGVFRDLKRTLSADEEQYITQDILSDRADTVHQLIQKMHDTLFAHGEGQLFNFMLIKLGEYARNNYLPKTKLMYDLYLGLMAIELKARLAMEFQYDVLRRRNTSYEERETHDKLQSNQRIITLKNKFKQALYDMENIKQFIGVKNYDKRVEWCVDDINADVEHGYVISDIKIEIANFPGLTILGARGAENYNKFIKKYPSEAWERIRFEIRQRKLISRGVLGKSKTWFMPCQNWKKFDEFEPQFVLLENTANEQYALTGIRFHTVDMFSGNKRIYMEGVYTAFEFDNNGTEKLLTNKVMSSRGRRRDDDYNFATQNYPTDSIVLKGFSVTYADAGKASKMDCRQDIQLCPNIGFYGLDYGQFISI